MPMLDWTHTNIWAVLVAAVATFLLGAVWYAALFGRQWAALNGYTPEKTKEMQAKRPPPVFFGTMLLCYTLLALVLSLLTHALGVTTAVGGGVLGLLLWLGPNAAVKMTDHIASDKPLGVFAIDSSFQLIYLVMMGAIIGAWR